MVDMNTQQQNSRYQTGHKGAKEESKWQGVGETKTEGQRECVHVCQSWFQSNHQLNGYVLGGHTGSDPDRQRQKKRVNDRGLRETKTEGQRKCVHVCQSWFQSNHQLIGCVMDVHTGSDPDREVWTGHNDWHATRGASLPLKACWPDGKVQWEGRSWPEPAASAVSGPGHTCATQPHHYHLGVPVHHNYSNISLGVPVQHNHNKISPGCTCAT